MLNQILSLNRTYKKIIIITSDLFSNFLASIIFFILILDTNQIAELPFFLISIIFFPIFITFDLYNNILRYTGTKYFLKIFFASLINALLCIIILNYFFDIDYFLLFFQPFVFFIFIMFTRAFLIFIYNLTNPQKDKKNILVYGAGEAGFESIKILNNIYKIPYVIDDDKNRQGQFINGIKIISSQNISKIIYKENINSIYVAISNLSENKRINILNILKKLGVQIKILSDLSSILDQEIKYSDFQNINEEDLLDRQIVTKKMNLKYLDNKNILITGGGGTIGSELCIQLLNTKINKLIIADNSEYNLYKIEEKIKKQYFGSIQIHYLLIDINDEISLKYLFKIHNLNVVYHTAAYKHVPIVEENIIESIKNNFFSTLSLVKLSIDFKVDHFVYISTDKAVRPTNIMGATKRMSEIFIQSLSKKIRSKTNCKLCIVRFGNVIGSSGSAINLFSKQIREGGPVTITHPDITRYFMTRKEAALLIFECCNFAKQGEIFLLDMGKPVKILNLVKKMIQLYGFKEQNETNQDGIEIKFIGLRKGEKIFEELLVDHRAKPTHNKYIYISDEKLSDNININKQISMLQKSVSKQNVKDSIDILEQCVESFKFRTI